MKKSILSVLGTLLVGIASAMPEELPDVSTLDPHWAKDALTIHEWGWGKLEKDVPITQTAFVPGTKGVSMALPYSGQYADFALKTPERLERIVIDADKLIVKHKITGDELDKMVVYTSLDGKNYTMVKPEISCLFYSAAGSDKQKVTYVRVTLRGNFYGKYFRIFAPWDKPGYVYRFFNGPQRVKAFAYQEEFPDVSTLDSHWAKDALTIHEWGWGNLEKDVPITQTAFVPRDKGVSMALPYSGQYADFALKTPEQLERIVIDADKLIVKHKIIGDELDKMVVYTSLDGKNFTMVKPEISCFFYSAVDHRKQKVTYVRVTLSGNFYGKYFRIFAPWDKPGYVYRFFNGPQRVKAFAKLKISNFSLPLSTDKDIAYTFDISGIRDLQGKIVFKLGDGAVLAERPLADFKQQTSATVNVPLKGLSAGIHTAHMDIVRSDGVILAHRSQKFAYCPDKTVLKSIPSAQWQPQNVFIGSRKVPFWRAEAAGAGLEFEAPADGIFRVYAVIRGKSQFKFTAPDGRTADLSLELWNPGRESNPYVFGENFIGIYPLKKGDKLTFTAVDSGAMLGEVFVLPATAEQQKIFTDETPADQSPCVIAHDDGFSDFFYREMTLPIMQNRIAALKKANVIAYDWCIGTSATNYPSKVGTMFGKQRGIKFSRVRDRQAAERMEKLIQTTGKDSLQIFREETRKHHMRYSITLRANAFYGATDRDKNAQYLMDHPEFFINDPISKSIKPSYAYKEVRDFYLALAKEIAAYKPDALVIEFLRHPPYFGYDKPLIEKYRQLYGSCNRSNYMDERWLNMIGDIMTDWVQEVYREIKKIHPDIELEINFDCENYRKHGVDMESILKLGIVDAISPGFYGNNAKKNFPLQPFKEMIRTSPKKVKLYPRVETTIEGHDPTPEEEAGLVKRPTQIYCSKNQWKAIFYQFMQEGADGIRPFNVGGLFMAQLLNDRADVKRFVTFTEPLLDIRYRGTTEPQNNGIGV